MNKLFNVLVLVGWLVLTISLVIIVVTTVSAESINIAALFCYVLFVAIGLFI